MLPIIKTVVAGQTDGRIYISSFLTHKEYHNPSNWDRRFANK